MHNKPSRIEYPKHEVRVDYETTINDDFSVFITKDVLNTNTILSIGVNVYKREDSTHNKKLYASGEIKITNSGVLEYENR